MSLLLQEMQRTYVAMRGVSQGASITLAAVSGGFQARFSCAEKAARVLGTKEFTDLLHPLLHIPLEDAHKSIMRLAETFSVALVDTVTDECGTRFVLVWKIMPRAAEMQVAINPHDGFPEEPQRSTDNLDEY